MCLVLVKSSGLRGQGEDLKSDQRGVSGGQNRPVEGMAPHTVS